MTIQNEFRDIVFEFAKMASRQDGILSIILFGSVARGDADKRSDIDILVVFDTEKRDLKELKERREISQMSLDMGKKFDKNIQTVFSNKNFDGLDRQFVETVFREGEILFGKNPQVDIEKLKLEPYSLFHYSLKELVSPEKMKIKRAFYGHETRKNYKGKIYKSCAKGLLDELGGKRTGIASFLVPSKKSQDIVNVLRRFGVKFEKTDVWISRV
jgi:predicted nucleotidyltransferase